MPTTTLKLTDDLKARIAPLAAAERVSAHVWMVSALFIQAELAEAGYRVHLARSGRDGLERLALLLPAAVLLDVVMPGLSGWETLSEIRANPKTEAVPVLITSVMDEKPPEMELQVQGWLTKPVHGSEVLEMLKEVTVPNGD